MKLICRDIKNISIFIVRRYVEKIETDECVKNDIKAMFYPSQGFRLRFWDILKYLHKCFETQKILFQLFLSQLILLTQSSSWGIPHSVTDLFQIWFRILIR